MFRIELRRVLLQSTYVLKSVQNGIHGESTGFLSRSSASSPTWNDDCRQCLSFTIPFTTGVNTYWGYLVSGVTKDCFEVPGPVRNRVKDE